jgi:hypothetical protein
MLMRRLPLSAALLFHCLNIMEARMKIQKIMTGFILKVWCEVNADTTSDIYSSPVFDSKPLLLEWLTENMNDMTYAMLIHISDERYADLRYISYSEFNKQAAHNPLFKTLTHFLFTWVKGDCSDSLTITHDIDGVIETIDVYKSVV